MWCYVEGLNVVRHAESRRKLPPTVTTMHDYSLRKTMRHFNGGLPNIGKTCFGASCCLFLQFVSDSGDADYYGISSRNINGYSQTANTLTQRLLSGIRLG